MNKKSFKLSVNTTFKKYYEKIEKCKEAKSSKYCFYTGKKEKKYTGEITGCQKLSNFSTLLSYFIQ